MLNLENAMMYLSKTTLTTQGMPGNGSWDTRWITPSLEMFKSVSSLTTLYQGLDLMLKPVDRPSMAKTLSNLVKSDPHRNSLQPL